MAFGRRPQKTTRTRTEAERLETLQAQLSVFAREYGERQSEEARLRKVAENASSLEERRFEELKAVYGLQLRHMKETISFMEQLLVVFSKFSDHVKNGRISLNVDRSKEWAEGFRELVHEAGLSLVRQREELTQFLDEPDDEEDAA